MGKGRKGSLSSSQLPVVIFLGLLMVIFVGALAILGMTWKDGGARDSETVQAVADAGETQTASQTEEITIRSETEAAGSLEQPEEETISLLFGGDVLLSDHVLGAYERGGGIQGVLGEGFRSEISQADVFMVNQEFPFSNRGVQAEDKQYTFRLPPEKVSIFQEMGIDIVTLANNHALDYGTDALLDTCSVLDGAGILHVGAGADLETAKDWETIEIKGRTIGFLGATRVIPVPEWAATRYQPGMLSTYDPAVLLEQIGKAKEVCDYVVVYVHWGIEREEYPKEYQQSLGRQYIDAGADLVVGSHPHVLQGIEYYQGKPIVYSLGNLVFGSSIPKTMLLKVEWDGKETRLSAVPGTSSAGYTRDLTAETEKQEFFDYLESISSGITVDEEGAILPQNQ